MRLLISLVGVLCLSSCTQNAESPLRNSHGTPMVIRIPGVKKGATPRPEQVVAIDTKLFDGRDPDRIFTDCLASVGESYGSGRAHLDGMTGEVKTHRGEVFHAYFPIVKTRSTSPRPQAERATNRMAEDLYLRAKRHWQVYPMTDLALRN